MFPPQGLRLHRSLLARTALCGLAESNSGSQFAAATVPARQCCSCMAESPFLSLFAPWEERYVVAQWDQRGTGKTFGKSGTPANMTMEQLTQDAIEVTQYVLSRLKVHKLILVGFSWGAELGLNVIRSKPELFHAFVGTGQPINGRDTFERHFACLSNSTGFLNALDSDMRELELK